MSVHGRGEEARSRLNDWRVEIMGRPGAGGLGATYQDRKYPSSLSHFTPNSNPIQEGLGTSLQGLV